MLDLPAGWEPCWTFGSLAGAVAAEPPPDEPGRSAALAAEVRGRGWVAFSAQTLNGDWDLFRMRPDGSKRRPLIATPEFHEAGVRYSPDSTRLLYYRIPKGDELDNNTYGTFELVIADANGAHARVYGRGYSWASWGPDGRQLACLTSKGIQIVEVNTGRIVRAMIRPTQPRLPTVLRSVVLLLLTLTFSACDGPPGGAGNGGVDENVTTLGAVEITARLLEVPEGAIFQRELYDYATILKYEVVAVHRGPLEKGATVFVGHYNPWKPRAQAADKRAANLGGTVRRFRAGDLHRLALDASMDDHYMGGIVDKYFGQHSGSAYWAVWTNAAN